VVGERLRIGDGAAIDETELQWRFEPSGGPGGQHANRAHSRATVTFDVTASPSLSDAQRDRLQRRLGAVVTVSADDERSQRRNRVLAQQRLLDRLADGLREPRRRTATKPTAGGRRRRLEAKSRRSALKSSRRRRPGDE
jgi:ribosome-associated protein